MHNGCNSHANDLMFAVWAHSQIQPIPARRDIRLQKLSNCLLAHPHFFELQDPFSDHLSYQFWYFSFPGSFTGLIIFPKLLRAIPAAVGHLPKLMYHERVLHADKLPFIQLYISQYPFPRIPSPLLLAHICRILQLFWCIVPNLCQLTQHIPVRGC